MQLERDGVSVEEMERAAEQDRLAMLPVERVLSGPALHTPRQVAELAGVPLAFLLAAAQAAGLPRPDPDEVSASDRDLEITHTYARFLDAGLPKERLIEVIGVFGRGLSHAADAVMGLTGEAFLREGVTEHELALANAHVARELLPRLGPVIEHVLQLHLLDRMRSVHFRQSKLLSAGELPDTHEVAVCFADLVGFTPLGATLPPREIGLVVRRLEQLTGEAAALPVRFVKTIGDGVMLVSPDVGALIDCVRRLMCDIASDGTGLPALRAGIATGTALMRSGDWFGHPVNLASRLAALAEPGTILATDEVRAATGSGARWSPAGPRRIRGVEGEVKVVRLHLTDQDDGG